MQLVNSSGRNPGVFDLLADLQETLSVWLRAAPKTVFRTGLIVNGKGKLSNPLLKSRRL
jgi:hypothetical protein